MPKVFLSESDKSTFSDQQFIRIAYNGKVNSSDVSGGKLDYIVTFTANNRAYQILSILSGQEISAPVVNPTADIEGYVFEKWTLNDEDVTFPITPTGDLNFTAKFEEQSSELKIEFTLLEGERGTSKIDLETIGAQLDNLNLDGMKIAKIINTDTGDKYCGLTQILLHQEEEFGKFINITVEDMVHGAKFDAGYLPGDVEMPYEDSGEDEIYDADGVKTDWDLSQNMEPLAILIPNTVNNVTVNDVVLTSDQYTYNNTTGILHFNTAPENEATITYHYEINTTIILHNYGGLSFDDEYSEVSAGHYVLTLEDTNLLKINTGKLDESSEYVIIGSQKFYRASEHHYDKSKFDYSRIDIAWGKDDTTRATILPENVYIADTNIIEIKYNDVVEIISGKDIATDDGQIVSGTFIYENLPEIIEESGLRHAEIIIIDEEKTIWNPSAQDIKVIDSDNAELTLHRIGDKVLPFETLDNTLAQFIIAKVESVDNPENIDIYFTENHQIDFEDPYIKRWVEGGASYNVFTNVGFNGADTLSDIQLDGLYLGSSEHTYDGNLYRYSIIYMYNLFIPSDMLPEEVK